MEAICDLKFIKSLNFGGMNAITEDSQQPPLIKTQGRRFKGNRKHLNKFRYLLETKGIDGWNDWRKEHYKRGLDLRGIDLSYLDLRGIDLHRAKLEGADFRHANLWGAGLQYADLTKVSLDEAILNYAFLEGANLFKATLVSANLAVAIAPGAKFPETDLSHANLSGADLRGSKLTDAKITGISAWDIETDAQTVQKDLIIEGWDEPLIAYVDAGNRNPYNVVIKTNNLETAHLLYLATRRYKNGKPEGRDRLRDVLETMTNNLVLILGNFGPQRKSVLNAIRFKLAGMHYAPVVFDFHVPSNRDLIDTVFVLAGLSSFIIADLTEPRSVPLETMLITSGLTIPFAPIIEKSEKSFSMLNSLQAKYYWVMKAFQYRNEKHLVKSLKNNIVIPSLKMKKRISNHRKKFILSTAGGSAKYKKVIHS